MLRIGLGIPFIDSIPGEAFDSFLNVAYEIGRVADIVIITPNGIMPHDNARIAVAEVATKKQCDLLMFVDADTVIPAGAFLRLFRTMVREKPAVVSGYYIRRGYPWTSVWASKVPDPILDISPLVANVDAKTGIHVIKYTGLGCALIDWVWVQKNLLKPYFQHTKNEVQGGTIITDDVTFYKQIDERHGIVLGDADIRCGHVGPRQVYWDKDATKLRAEVIENEFYSKKEKENG